MEVYLLISFNDQALMCEKATLSICNISFNTPITFLWLPVITLLDIILDTGLAFGHFLLEYIYKLGLFALHAFL